jgi:hypothetical protein
MSATERTGLDELRGRLLEAIGYALAELGEAAAFTDRQVRALEQAGGDRQRFREHVRACLERPGR